MDVDSGEIRPACERCDPIIAELIGERDGLRTESKGWRTRYQNLARDKEAEAAGHHFWPMAVEVFNYWRERMGRSAEFTADRFWLLEPFLRRAEKKGLDPMQECKDAIDGRHNSDWHMKRGRYQNREGRKHNDFEQIFENQRNYEACRDNAPIRLAAQQANQRSKAERLMASRDRIAQALRDRALLLEFEDSPTKMLALLRETEEIAAEWT